MRTKLELGLTGGETVKDSDGGGETDSPKRERQTDNREKK